MKLYPDVVDRFIAESGRIRTAPSARSYVMPCRQLQRTDPDRLAWAWTRDDVLAYLGRPGLAPKTVSTRRTVVQSVFGWAAYRGLIPTDPSAGIEYAVRPGHGNVRAGNWLTDDQVTGLLAGMPTDTARQRRDRMILVVGFNSGLRRMELVKLMWDDLTPDFATLRVAGKGRKVVRMPLPEQLTEELAVWRREAAGPAVLPSGAQRAVATWRDGRTPSSTWSLVLDHPAGIDTIRRVVHAAGERVGVPDLAPHDMRRSFAGWLDSTGLDIRAIRDLMRHSSVVQTERYLAANPNRARAALAGVRRGDAA